MTLQHLEWLITASCPTHPRAPPPSEPATSREAPSARTLDQGMRVSAARLDDSFWATRRFRSRSRSWAPRRRLLTSDTWPRTIDLAAFQRCLKMPTGSYETRSAAAYYAWRSRPVSHRDLTDIRRESSWVRYATNRRLGTALHVQAFSPLV